MANLFEKLFGTSETEPLKKLHPDFTRKYENWFFNAVPAPLNRLQYLGSEVEAFDKRKMKLRFAFNDPSQLDGCKFHAKIGKNADPALPYKYIGFAYATDAQRQELQDWGQKFPFCELLVGLNRDWIQRRNSERITIHDITKDQT